MNRLSSPNSAVLTCRRPPDAAHKLIAALCLLLLVTLSLVYPVHALRSVAQDPYPAPTVPEIAPLEDSPPTADVAQPYPAPTSDVLGTVGEGAQSATAESFPAGSGLDAGIVSTTPQASQSGLYFLWGGFLAALLIFATAVVGSLVLFSRRVE